MLVERLIFVADSWLHVSSLKGGCCLWITWLLLLDAILPMTVAVPIKRTSVSKRSEIFRKRSSQLITLPSSYDWCESKDDKMSLDRLRQMALSLEHSENFNWPDIRNGLIQLEELTVEVARYSDDIMDKVNKILNQGGIKIFAEMYLNYSETTPKAYRETSENAIDMALEASEMARKIENVLRKHAGTLSRMLLRLEVLHRTETNEHLQSMLHGYSGETHIVLCKMQEVFHEVAPDYFLPGPSDPDTDMSNFETATLGEKKNVIMRRYATYGVSMRHQEILKIVREDLNLLQRQILKHTKR